jgi:ubiquinone/menaquinone biosynthesis C-methylase UbiE
MFKIKKVSRPDKNIYNDNYFFKIPKEYYKQSVKMINKKKISNLLDIGCSNGSFLYYAKNKIDCNFVGVEPLSNLISLAKKNVKDVNFIQAKLFDKKLNKIRYSFDVVTAMGVLNLFDDPEEAIKRLISFLKKKSGSRLIMINSANVYSIDTISRYKYSNAKIWECGQNMFSIYTIKKIALKNKLKFSYEKANLIAIKKRKDVMRSWTVDININKKLKKTRYLCDGMGRLKNTFIFTLTK